MGRGQLLREKDVVNRRVSSPVCVLLPLRQENGEPDMCFRLTVVR